MTGCKIWMLAFLLAWGAAPQAQVVVEPWQINIANCTETGNDWLAQPNPGHSIDFIPANASQNTFNKDVLVVLTEQNANATIRILDAVTGEHLSAFETVPTGDSFREHARMRTSDDGYIFVTSFGGRVQHYNVAGTWLGDVVLEVFHQVAGNTRALAVSGSFTDKTLRIYTARGNQITVFGWEGAAIFQRLGIITTANSGDIMTLGAAGNRVYCGSILTEKLFMHEISFAPFSFEPGVEIAAYDSVLCSSIDISPSQTEFAIATLLVLHGECGLGTVNTTGDEFENIPPVAAIDFNSNGLYDGGISGRFKSAGGTADICIEPSGTTAYAYYPHNNPTSTPSAAIAKIGISTSAADEWMIY